MKNLIGAPRPLELHSNQPPGESTSNGAPASDHVPLSNAVALFPRRTELAVPAEEQPFIYVEQPRTFFTALKTAARKTIEALDRPGLAPAGQFLAQRWLAIRDRALPADEKITLGRKDGIWFSRQADVCLTYTKLQWGNPLRLLSDLRDDFFHTYTPQPGDTIVCVGAGTGADVLACAKKAGPSATIHAIEAHPHTHKALDVCCELNRLQNVMTYQCAITDQDGSVRIQDGPSSLSNSILSGGRIAVPGFTLDSFASQAGIQRIDLLLMNIEGAERLAIEGMRDIIGRVKHAVICCHDFRADRGDGEDMRTQGIVRHYLQSHGFHTSVRPDDPRPWVRSNVYASNKALA